LLILLNQIYTMKNFFIVRLFTFITLILLGTAPVFSSNNKNFTVAHKAITQIPSAKPAPVQVKQAPAYRLLHRKPTKEDTILMRDKSISGQYKYLLTKTYHIQEPFITSFYKNLKDTINVERRKRLEAETKLAAQTKTTSELQTNVSEKEKSLAQSNARVNSVNFLGIYIDKSVYNLIMWGLVIALGATAAIVIVRSGSHSREARYRINLYNELEEEFKTYKAKANEKEKKLARELQTERNKVDELMGRS
jgi:Skp family chaperone for outer membrane proteins